MIELEELYALYRSCSSVTIDSRKIEENCLFVAIRGERFDGNEYAAEALNKGAAYAIVDRAEHCTDPRMRCVEDSLKTLQQLANHHRRQFEIPVIGITGSNGKTTTKELIREVMGSHYRTHCTQGNFNNHIGVPLTLLAMPDDAEVAVIEMGANHQGEIAFLSEIAAPTHGIITNIGKAHLEGFGGLEGVKKGKSELYRYLAAHRGLAFVNLDEAFLQDLARPVAHQVVYRQSAKPSPDNSIYETIFLGDRPFIRAAFFSGEDDPLEVDTQLIGCYNFNNVMSAITIGRYFKVPGPSICRAIAAYQPTNNRSQIIQRQNNTFILDAYNANPSSVGNALENFAAMKADRKIAILGDMLELGEYSPQEHQQILNKAKSLGLEELYLVGPLFGGWTKEFADWHFFENTASLKEWFDQQEYQNTSFLLKGSRGMALEKLLAQ